jgi:hypothetical protein
MKKVVKTSGRKLVTAVFGFVQRGVVKGRDDKDIPVFVRRAPKKVQVTA